MLCPGTTARTRRTALGTPVHLDAAITMLNSVGDAHVLVPVVLSATGRTVSVEGDERAVWELSAGAELLTDRSKIDLYQGRDPASKQ